MKTIEKMFLAVSVLAFVVGCSQERPQPQGYIVEHTSGGGESCRVETFTVGPQNILYFNCTSRTFAQALTDYQERHPNTRIVSHSADGTGYYGSDIGYIVVTETKPVEEITESWAPH